MAGLFAVVALFAVPAAASAQAPLPVLDPAPLGGDPLRTPAAVQQLSGAGCRGGRRAAVICLINRARAGVGLRGFRGNRALARAARRHARDMARSRFFAHQRSGGPSLRRRARAAGWRGGRLGEAIAYGCGTGARPVEIVRSWLASPPHAAILLSNRHARAGLGIAKPPVSCRGATFVLDTGR